MGSVSRVHTFASAAVLTAAQLNNEFDNLLTSSAINGGLDATNLGVTAGQATASKALVIDSSRNLDDGTTSNQINNLVLSGTLTVAGATTQTGALSIDDTTDSTSTTTGSIHTDGGMGIAKDLIVGNDVKVGGGYGATGATISTAGVIQANGAITSDGAVTGATLAGTISTAAQNSITSASSLATVGTITSGTWSGVIDGSATMTLGSDATGDIYYRDASGFLERLASGADGTVLTGTGAGAIPAWESPTVGDITSVVAGAGMTGGGTTGDVTLNVIGGDGITANADDVAITAAQTTVTSVLNAALALGRDADNQIKFGTDDQIIFEVAGGDGVTFKASGEIEATSLDISGDADIDGTLEADAITLGGTALGSLYSPIAGSSSIATVGTVGTGTWQGTKVASAYLDDQTAHLNVTQSFTGAKTFGAATQFNSTVTVGVNDTGYDVQLFGATSGSNILWDQSADDLIFTNAGIAVGSDATGDIYYRDASGFLERLGASTDGYVLTTGGAGSIPAWEAVSAGVSLSGSTNNTIATVTGANALEGEANLTFDGSTLTVAGDQHITNGNGLIMGHTARVQVGWTTGENQILGTDDADANLSITRYSNDNGPPNLFFGKSRGSLGGNTIVADGDPLGRISFCGSDGVDMRSVGAWIEAECDGEFEADNVSGRIIFATTPDSAGVQDPVERVRINSAGQTTHTITDSNTTSIYSKQSHGSNAGVHLDLHYSGYAPDSSGEIFLQCRDTTAFRCYIYSDGDLANHDGTYGTISDVKLKQDITDVRSYWSDFKALQYRKFRHKADVELDADAPYRLGLIAQEVEAVFPALVPESPDGDIETEEAVVDEDGVAVLDEEGNPTYETISTPSGTTHKWVKSSIIEGPIMGSVVQELMTRLEAAEAKIAALESA